MLTCSSSSPSNLAIQRMMKLSLIAFALLACWAVGVLSEDLDTAWEYHKAHFPVKASSAEEREKRRSLFAACHDEIEQHNKRNHTFQMAHNLFSTMTVNEKKRFLGLSAPSPADARMIGSEVDYSSDLTSDRQLPASVDFRTHKCMPAVKNQGGCGSCWAFAATTPVEFGSCLRNGKNVPLSEQQLVDCSKASAGCNGGWYHTSWTYLASARGSVTSASYPYTARAATCDANKGIVGAKVSSSVVYAKGETNIMNQLAKNRLVAVAIAVINSFFGYKSGVYTAANCKTNIVGYHAIVAVGYGTLNGVKYWVIRNSWGSSWGAAGYILFQRGVDLCMVESWNPATATVV